MTIEARNLTEQIGSEVSGDIDALLDAGAALRSLLLARGVLVFRGLGLEAAQQTALARSLGTVREEGDRGVYKITLDKAANTRADYLKGSFLWHIDGTHDDVPPFATMLTGVTLSPTGGQTEFANSYAAYEHLTEATRQRIAGLRVVHSVQTSMTRAGIEATPENLAYWRSLPDRTHSLVWTHRSDRKSLVIGCHASHVEGMDRQEGQALLQELLDWTTQPAFKYRHDWTPGDLVIWDNTGVLHRAEPYPMDSGRLMHRTTLVGEEPFA